VKSRKQNSLKNVNFTKNRIKESRGATGFIFGLLIDWTFKGRVKGWEGTTLQVLLPFLLMIFTIFLVADAFDEGRTVGRSEGERKSSETN
jgi:hypothetical protein